jgi:mycothiol synthase
MRLGPGLPSGLVVSQSEVLSSIQQDETRRLIAQLPEEDSRVAIGEKFNYLMTLSNGRSTASCVWWLVRTPNSELVAIASLNQSNRISPSAHVVVGASKRRQGIGSYLLESIGLTFSTASIRVWNVGDTHSGRQFAKNHVLRHIQNLELMSASTRHSCIVRQDRFEGFSASVVATSELDPSWETLVSDSYSDSAVTQLIASSSWWPSAFAACITQVPDGQLLGIVIGRKVLFHSAPATENHLMAVSKATRGKGFGRVLTELLLQHTANLGISHSVSYVDAANKAAIRAHANSGFRSVSRSSIYELSQVTD